MHPHKLPEEFVRQVSSRTGKIHPFDEIISSRTAMLVIDMQNYFCAPGYQGEVPASRSIVPTINRLAEGLRTAGGHVVWVKGTSDGAEATWSVYNDLLNTADRRERRNATLSQQHEGFALWPELHVDASDGEIVKTRFSAFLQGSSGLDAYLRDRSIDTVIITGTTTDVCCDSTARDAAMLNYKTIMVADANATYSDNAHLAALCAFYNVFGDVQTADELLSFLR